MIVAPIKTTPITTGEDLFSILDQFLPELEEESVVVITSKIISISQNSIAPKGSDEEKKQLIRREADYYYEDQKLDQYGVLLLTLKNNMLIANAGIDESNGNDVYILWPKDIQKTTNDIWNYIRTIRRINKVGVIVTDSRVTILRKGTVGVGMSWCGFKPLHSYINTPDIFGRNLKNTQAAILDGLAASAVLVMGEGKEQTPLAVISDIPFVEFQDRIPSEKELQEFTVSITDDIYSSLLSQVKWNKNKK